MNEMKRIDIVGENYAGKHSDGRKSCRGIVTDGDRILLSYETLTDQWMIPGGGQEGNESLEDCCIREVAEETGYRIEVSPCLLEIDEYYEEEKYFNFYYLGKVTGRCERNLTEREKETGMEPRWIPIEEAIAVFATHASYADTDEMRRGMYLREYSALTEILKKDGGKWFPNAYFITGTAYAGKSTMVKLLAERHGGVACEENYHDALLDELDENEFPCLCYTRDLEDWHDFIRRSPEEYEAWFDGVSKECEILELRILSKLAKQEKPVFVDTNISLETLREIADPKHVLVMLADPMISVNRFFERPDKEKQFLYRLIMEEEDPEAAMENYRQGLMRINSQERYDRLLHSGFRVIKRDEKRSIEETLALVEEVFGLDH